MARVRSARGDVVDFEMLSIKAQLAAAPVPKPVQERMAMIEERDSSKSVKAALAAARAQADSVAEVSTQIAPKRK